MSSLPPIAKSDAKSWIDAMLKLAPGVVACLALASAAALIGRQIGQPALLIALVLGLLLHPLYGKVKAGADWSAKILLEIAIALLGFRLSLEVLTSLGAPLILGVAGAVLATIALTVAFARIIGADPRAGLLAGGATAICGASACLAIASALPRDKLVERTAAVVIVMVTVLSTIAMVAYPLAVGALGLSGFHAGAFLGGSIHNVPQAVGAGYAVSPEAGDAATMVKLFRVAMILPVTIVVASLGARLLGLAASTEGGRPKALPWFILAYAAAALLNSTGAVPKMVTAATSEASTLFLSASVAAIGIKSSARGLLAEGPKPIALVIFATLCLAALIIMLAKAGLS